MDKAVETCVQKYFEYNKNESVLKGNILSLIKEHIEDYSTYDHHYPYTVQWVLESRCNLRCEHCLYLKDPQKYCSDNNISTKQALKLIDELFEMDILSLSLTGGEVFLREDLFEIIAKIKTKNIALTLLTNATLITPEITDTLNKYLNPNTDKLQISLDGATSETHDKIRGKGAFDKTIQGIQLLVNSNIPTTLVCIPTTQNISELVDVYHLAESLKVKRIAFGRFKPFDKSQQHLTPDINQLFETIAKIIDLDKEKENSMLGITAFTFYDLIAHKIASKYVSEYNSKTLPLENETCSCHHNERLSIDRDGSVYMCTYAKDLEFAPLGNIKEKNLLEIWDACNDNILFQKRQTDKMQCKSCNYFQKTCFGGCPIESQLQYGSINAPDKNCVLGRALVTTDKT